MKCVILAAGEGVRMRPLTLKKPKPLVEVRGKSLLEHIVNATPKEINEIILVVGYLKDQIKSFCKDEFCGRSVKYVIQEKKLGTADALKLCRPRLQKEDKFLMLFADDLHSPTAIKKCLNHNLCLLVQKHSVPSMFGVVTLNKDGSIKEIAEKPENPQSNLVSTGAMVLTPKIFDYEPDRHPASGEYYLTSMISKMLADHKIFVEHTDFWHPIASPEDILKAEEMDFL